MNFKKYPSFMLHTNLTPGPAHTTGGITLPKFSPPLDFRSTVSEPFILDQNTTLARHSTLHSNTPIPINTLIEITEVFKNSVNNIIVEIPCLTAYMSYKYGSVILQLE